MADAKKYRLMGVQMRVTETIGENLARILGFIHKAGECKADFVLFPEMALTDSKGKFKQKECAEALAQIARLCARENVCAIVGTRYRAAAGCYIQSRIYGRSGVLIGAHNKMMLTMLNRRWSLPGRALNVFKYKKLCFGCLICNDLWVTPEHSYLPDARLVCQLARKGARLIFHSIKTGSDPFYRAYHESNLLLRARAGNLYIATANVAAAEGVNTPSGVVTPEGKWLVQAKRKGEQYYLADISIKKRAWNE